MKRGRPKARDPREIIVKVRLTSEEDAKLQTLCEWYGKNVSQVIRCMIDDTYMHESWLWNFSKEPQITELEGNE